MFDVFSRRMEKKKKQGGKTLNESKICVWRSVVSGGLGINDRAVVVSLCGDENGRWLVDALEAAIGGISGGKVGVLGDGSVSEDVLVKDRLLATVDDERDDDNDDGDDDKDDAKGDASDHPPRNVRLAGEARSVSGVFVAPRGKRAVKEVVGGVEIEIGGTVLEERGKASSELIVLEVQELEIKAAKGAWN